MTTLESTMDWSKVSKNSFVSLFKPNLNYLDTSLRSSIVARAGYSIVPCARSGLGRVLLVAYTIRRRNDEEVTRIISARRASRKEKKKSSLRALQRPLSVECVLP
jgi:hypothetical protein